jgi:hypothetical protein
MIFLDDPPDGVTDRCKEGADLCAEWGITTSGTSVWRLWRSYAVEWRTSLALQVNLAPGESLEALRKRAEHMLAARNCEMLANPDTPPAILLGLGRLDLRQKAVELARQKHKDNQADETERALASFEVRASRDRWAQFALAQLKKALDGKAFPGAPRSLMQAWLPPKPK